MQKIVRIEERTHHQLKVYAAMIGQSVESVAQAAIQKHLESEGAHAQLNALLGEVQNENKS